MIVLRFNSEQFYLVICNYILMYMIDVQVLNPIPHRGVSYSTLMSRPVFGLISVNEKLRFAFQHSHVLVRLISLMPILSAILEMTSNLVYIDRSYIYVHRVAFGQLVYKELG